MIRRSLHVAWAGAVLCALGLTALFPLPGEEEARPWAMGLMAFPVAGALILVRRGGNRIGLLLATVGTAAGVIFIGGWLAFRFPGNWSRYLEALQAVAVVVQFWAIISLLYLFPDGELRGRAARWSFRTFTAWMTVMAVVAAIRPAPLEVSGRDNPLGVGPEVLNDWFEVGIVGIPVGVVMGVVVLLARRRSAGSVERAQMQWFTSASTLVIALVAVIALVPEGEAEAVTYPIVVGGFWALPAAIVLAVLRYRLFEIDRLVSRTVSYGAVLASLALVYVTVVFLVSGLLPSQGDLAVASSTLVVAASFRPLTRRVQLGVDRRFDRPRYDREQEVARFVGRLRDEVELDGLVAGLLGTVTTTVQPAAAAIWVRPSGGSDAGRP